MLIGITGHTRGIGRSLSDTFKKNNHHITGFSQSIGFNIGNSESRKKILEQANNFDIFINNAYHPTGQIEILKEILDLWKDTNKIIINISSQIVHKPVPGYDQTQPLECGNCNYQFCIHCAGVSYKRSKTELNDYVNNYTGSVRILNVIVDITDTEFYLIPKNLFSWLWTWRNYSILMTYTVRLRTNLEQEQIVLCLFCSCSCLG